jgi:hypothetical protein
MRAAVQRSPSHAAASVASAALAEMAVQAWLESQPDRVAQCLSETAAAAQAMHRRHCLAHARLVASLTLGLAREPAALALG